MVQSLVAGVCLGSAAGSQSSLKYYTCRELAVLSDSPPKAGQSLFIQQLSPFIFLPTGNDLSQKFYHLYWTSLPPNCTSPRRNEKETADSFLTLLFRGDREIHVPEDAGMVKTHLSWGVGILSP